ncbi:hypothetical protein ACQ4PT_042857 [Festuca glaucescens]
MHLAAEAKIGGPVSYRSMWFLERYLGKVKSNVRNKAHPEGSIAEVYLADECMTCCSRYIVGFETKHNMSSRDEDNEELAGHPGVKEGSILFPNDGKPLGKPRNYVIRSLAKLQAHRYLLFNCSDVNPYLRVHADEITNNRSVNPNTFEKIQNEMFHEWFRSHDRYGYTVVNFSHLIHSGDKIEHEPFIFPDQVEQVFYVDDETKPGWSVVMKPPKPRGLYDTGNEEYAEDTEPFHVSHLAKMFKNKRYDRHWVRTDIEGTEVEDNTNTPSNEE